ncbi:MAG: ABC transporter ATP-binding protein [Rhodobacteraceae bacterium]|nr:ABC transporter ATP-binding protein [Paracoccaceae bacterium]
MTALVKIDAVEKRFGDFVAVRCMNLSIDQGEFVAIMGPSGCGKTTTLRILAGLEQPTSGKILIGGRVMNDVSAHQRDTPMVWQSLALFPFLNVRENVEFGLKMRRVAVQERSRRAIDWLERMEIADLAGRMVDTLSGGQRQRVALARALVTEPQLLLLDEPLSALDAHLVIRMQGVLNRLQRELGITFIYVTHSQSEAFAMADRVVIMNNGGIAQVGSPRDIYRTPANRFVAEFVGRNNILTGNATVGGIDTAVGLVKTTHSVTTGSAVTLVIAADQIAISRKPAPGAVETKLISEEFVGSVVTLFLEAGDGTEFKVQLQERALAELDIHSGGSFHLTWPDNIAHILPISPS